MTDGGAVTFDDLSGGRPVVVLSPHPDDESLGCGALLGHAFAGPGAHVVGMTDGAASHPGSDEWPPARLSACRRAEQEAAVAILGGRPGDITRLGLDDAGMPELTAEARERIATGIADLARRLGAGLIVTTAAADPHCDHVVTAEIGARAARLGQMRCLAYPVWSRWAGRDGPAPVSRSREYRLDTAPMRERKRRAVAAHASQLGAVVGDDPSGFVLPADMVSMFVEAEEVFYECGSE